MFLDMISNSLHFFHGYSIESDSCLHLLHCMSLLTSSVYGAIMPFNTNIRVCKTEICGENTETTYDIQFISITNFSTEAVLSYL